METNWEIILLKVVLYDFFPFATLLKQLICIAEFEINSSKFKFTT